MSGSRDSDLQSWNSHVITIDANFSHHPKFIPEMVAEQEEGNMISLLGREGPKSRRFPDSGSVPAVYIYIYIYGKV